MICTQSSFKELSTQLFSYGSIEKHSYTAILMKEELPDRQIVYSFDQLRAAVVNCRISGTYPNPNQILTLNRTITLTLTLTLWSL